MYIKREIEETLLKISKSFQVITIYGSRQVGKTTVVDHIFGDTFNFITLDDTDELDLAVNNPKGFIDVHPWPLIIDEVQKAPKLLSIIKKKVDEQRSIWLKNDEERKLMYILTGSNQFELQESISESLAGRTALLSLASLSQIEKFGIKGRPLNVNIDELLTKEAQNKDLYRNKNEMYDLIFEGGMPDVVTKESERSLYFKSYIDTYIEKDVRKLINASNELQFRRFIAILALRTGQELVYSDIASDLGINTETCKRWISILETSGIIVLLQPYMANVSKRIIKSPKLYFMDTGLCAYLCKWPSAEMLRDGVMSGAFFETYIVSEAIKSFYNAGLSYEGSLYYYRDIDKKEVDLLLVENDCLYPIEIKKNEAPNKPTKNFKVLEKYNMTIKPGLVICNTDKIRPINDNAYLFPVSLLGL